MTHMATIFYKKGYDTYSYNMQLIDYGDNMHVYFAFGLGVRWSVDNIYIDDTRR